MSKTVDAQIEALLDEAEQNQQCLAATNPNLSRQLFRRFKQGKLKNPAPLLYARPDQWEKLSPTSRKQWQLRALTVLHPGWVFSCFSAALAYDLSVSNSLLIKTHIISSECHKARSKNNLATYAISDVKPEIVSGIRCTPIMRTLFDCARMTSLPKGLAIVDSALRQNLVNKTDLEAYFSTLRTGWRGAPKARTICSLASPLAESGGESIARGLIYELGFANPELQIPIADPVDSARSYRVDFLWRLDDGRLIFGEFDGRAKYTDPEMTSGRNLERVLIDERRRESRISFAGARIIRFDYGDLCNPRKFARLLSTFGVPRR